jgi:hypothetical protein
VFYVFWIRPRRRREQRLRHEPATPADASTDTLLLDGTPARTHSRTPRGARSHRLLGLTASLTAIALAVTLVYDEVRQDLPWTTYVAVALAVVGVGLLIGTFHGNGGGLVLIGALLAATLTVGSALPDGRIGTQRTAPVSAANVAARYRHGFGLLKLDLTGVSDPDALLGRTVTLDGGIGLARVVVPAGLPVRVDADIRAGNITVFGREDDGTDVSMSDGDSPPASYLTIVADQNIGHIEVISR